ncbi:AAA family ATPase, partial [Candidatus Saccharibacteria bacterium]|nr:AAA family ATPase [Candidatus Saccharibacteria bacterium]
MMKPTLYLMVGYPGSGKTTVAQYISKTTDAVHIWADEERKLRFGDKYDTGQSVELYDGLNLKAIDLLRHGKDVVFDTNFGLRIDRDKLRQMANDVGAKTLIIWLTTDRDSSKSRA